MLLCPDGGGGTGEQEDSEKPLWQIEQFAKKKVRDNEDGERLREQDERGDCGSYSANRAVVEDVAEAYG